MTFIDSIENLAYSKFPHSFFIGISNSLGTYLNHLFVVSRISMADIHYLFSVVEHIRKRGVSLG